MTQHGPFAGKVAVITGAASGIGLSLALRAAREGMKVALVDIEQAPLAEAVAAIKALGAHTIAVHADVADAGAMQSVKVVVEAKLGLPWLICNNAGVNKFKPMWSLTLAEWQWIVGVNLWGVINGIAVFASGLVSRNSGYIVNTASAAGLYATPGVGPYVGTKHAVVGLSESLYRELRLVGSDVGVSVVCPRLVATNMMTATRNEPGNTDPPAPVDLSVTRWLLEGAALDIQTPDMIAERVFTAIVNRQFWVLSHAEEMRDIVTNRVRQALDGENPDMTSADRISSTMSALRSGLITVDQVRSGGEAGK
jgi:NAD(P)-dependent dehydrogenase (short-subunit alcohol dehydrogenase family)